MTPSGQVRPADAPPLRSFRRRSRLTTGQANAIDRLWPEFGVVVDGEPLDLRALFGRVAPVALEIGFGMGEATVPMAAAQPDVDVLAVDVHMPGHGSLLREIDSADLTNVRVADGDAMVLLDAMLGAASLHEVRVFFPDPWPKRRHWKRRLVNAGFVDLVADRLRQGGRLHFATDWAHYAVQVRGLIDAHPDLELTDQVPWRPQTKFEQVGLAAGRPPYDVVAARR